MNKKESIHQLQERLAQRLAVSAQSGAVATWLAIELADERFLVPLKQSGEIFSLPTIHYVAHAQPWFLGVSNLRGLLFGVVDFAQFLELAPSTENSTERSSEACLVALSDIFGVNCALLVDRLLGLRSHEEFVGSRLLQDSNKPYFVSELKDKKGQLWREIDLSQLVTDNSFLDIRSRANKGSSLLDG